MDKVSASGNSANGGDHAPDDIPMAVRETPTVAPKTKVNKNALILVVAALGIGGMSVGALVALQLQRSQSIKSAIASQPQPTVFPSTPPSASPTAETMLGHFRYAQAPTSELVSLNSDPTMKLRKAAAKAFQEMEAAAQQEGVSLVPLSAFRSIDDQTYLFFDKKAERGQVAAERAKVSAPPGYSEHHTGYAIDIGDGNVPAANLSPTFENTPAYKWLKANAAFYSFEMSFPKNNKQGVSYEPWHWRFVGDQQSLETFYKARNAEK